MKNEFEGFSTLVQCSNKFGPYIVTGFLYCESNPQPIDKVINNSINSTNNKIWLITVRHVLYAPPPDVNTSPPSKGYEERLPFDFHICLKSKSSSKWEKIILLEDYLLKNGKIHNDDDIDIAAIEITDILKDKWKEQNDYIDYFLFHQDQFPTSGKDKNNEVMIVGFPESNYNFFSQLATKPEIKSGTIKSIWGSLLDGRPVFEVNIIVENGFSGSPVVSVSKDFQSNSEMTAKLNENHISFLGVAAGIKPENKTSIVFYGNLVEEVIKDGLPLFKSRYRAVDRN